jgi:hypothetical protein
MALLGIAAVNYDIDAIRAAYEEALVSLDLQHIRHEMPFASASMPSSETTA